MTYLSLLKNRRRPDIVLAADDCRATARTTRRGQRIESGGLRASASRVGAGRDSNPSGTWHCVRGPWKSCIEKDRNQLKQDGCLFCESSGCILNFNFSIIGRSSFGPGVFVRKVADLQLGICGTDYINPPQISGQAREIVVIIQNKFRQGTFLFLLFTFSSFQRTSYKLKIPQR